MRRRLRSCSCRRRSPQGRGPTISGQLIGFHAPHLLDVEVVQALRRLARAGEVHTRRTRRPSRISPPSSIRRHAHIDLLSRAWELRANLTAYDAMYVALAEAMDAPLVTCDGSPWRDTRTYRPGIEVVR